MSKPNKQVEALGHSELTSKELQDVFNRLRIPPTSPSKLEYWRAGVRSVIEAVNKALDEKYS
jgi:hypothetical protein